MKNAIKEIIPYVIVILVVVLVRLFIISPVTVNGESMNDTLQNGDLMLLKKYDKNNINRNDIVVFNYKKEKLIKRVIALPNEKIKCVSGIIYINNEEYDNKYAKGKTKDFEEVALGDDEYFVMGDNRENSHDSRAIGPIKKDIISGTTDLIIFPFSHIKKF